MENKKTENTKESKKIKWIPLGGLILGVISIWTGIEQGMPFIEDLGIICAVINAMEL